MSSATRRPTGLSPLVGDAFPVDAAHPVEADAGQAHLRLGLAALVGNHDHGLARPKDVAGVLGEATVQAHVE
jgi:hypothetical protein